MMNDILASMWTAAKFVSMLVVLAVLFALGFALVFIVSGSPPLAFLISCLILIFSIIAGVEFVERRK